MPRPHFQFTLTHAFCAVSVLCAFFSAAAWAGLFGVVLLGCVFGVATLCLAGVSRDGRYLVVGGVLTLVSGFTLMNSSVATGFGFCTLPCTVQVVDAAGMPVRSASVRIRDISTHGYPEGRPVHPIPAGEPGVSGVTDATGTVTLSFGFRNTSRTGLFVDEAHVYVSPYLWIQTEAPGFEREMIRLDSITGNNYDWNNLPLPHVKIQLKRSAQP